MDRFQVQYVGVSTTSNEPKFSIHYLQQITVRIYWIIVAPTERSVKYFGFLIGKVLVVVLMCNGQRGDTICRDIYEIKN